MPRAIKHIILLLTVLAALTCCTKEVVVFGDPNSADFQETSIGAIRQRILDRLDQPAKVSATFLDPLWSGFAEDQDAFMAGGDFGKVVVLAPKGKYTETIASLKKGDPVLLFGIISTVTPPGRQKSLLALEVR